MDMQLDNTYLFAESTLPILLSIIEGRDDFASLPEDDPVKTWFKVLKQWNYEYNKTSIAPTFFDEWITDIEKNTWEDDLLNTVWPGINKLEDLIVYSPESRWFDIKNTSEKETLTNICNMSFNNIIKKLSGKTTVELEWQNYRGTDILHLAKISFHLLRFKRLFLF